jgi:hypothetical protein
MGAEAKCTLTFGKTRAEGKALLETEALIFRGGDVRLSVPYKQMSAVEARDGTLRVTFPDGIAAFAIGDAAPKWAAKILNPPSRLDKLGVKPAHVVLVLGVKDPTFARELEARAARVTTRAGGEADVIFYAADSRAALDKLGSLQKHLRRDGAIWVIRPRGAATIGEADVMRAGKAAGLVDVKVARFSDTHTAEKFVIPLKDRPQRAPAREPAATRPGRQAAPGPSASPSRRTRGSASLRGRR